MSTPGGRLKVNIKMPRYLVVRDDSDDSDSENPRANPLDSRLFMRGSYHDYDDARREVDLANSVSTMQHYVVDQGPEYVDGVDVAYVLVSE